MKHITVISYPRSGTHLLIDLIRNNFSDYKHAYVSFSGIKNRSLDQQIDFIRRISKTHRIFKTHLFPQDFFSKETRSNKIFDYILSNSYNIYVYRDGRDVLVSQYYRLKKEYKSFQNISFSTFLRTKMNFQGIDGTPAFLWAIFNYKWLQHDSKLLAIKFSELIEKPENVLSSIKNYINRMPNEKFKNVCLTENYENELPFRFGNGIVDQKIISRTSIYFRKGIIGDYKNHFSKIDLDFFDCEVNRTTIKKQPKVLYK